MINLWPRFHLLPFVIIQHWMENPSKGTTLIRDLRLSYNVVSFDHFKTRIDSDLNNEILDHYGFSLYYMYIYICTYSFGETMWRYLFHRSTTFQASRATIQPFVSLRGSSRLSFFLSPLCLCLSTSDYEMAWQGTTPFSPSYFSDCCAVADGGSGVPTRLHKVNGCSRRLFEFGSSFEISLVRKETLNLFCI